MRKLLVFFFTVLVSINLFAATTQARFKTRINPSIKVTQKTIVEANKTQFYDINVKYPELTNKDNDYKELNNTIKNLMTSRVESFKKDAISSLDERKNIPESSRLSGLTITYDANVFKASDHLIASIRFTESMMRGGAAHPSTIDEVINYDLTAQKQLALSDLFKENSDYLKVIADFSKTQLKKKNQNEDQEWFNKGTEAIEKNYDVWNLTPTGIFFTFKEYQVAAYVYGRQEILVPYQTLATILNPSSPVYSCIKAGSCK